MTSKETLTFLVKHGYKLKKEKVDELKNIIEQDLEELESIKSCLADYSLDITNLREICMYYKMQENKEENKICCPNCHSNNVEGRYGIRELTDDGETSKLTINYICHSCKNEFYIEKKEKLKNE